MYDDYFYREEPKKFNVFPGANKYNKEKRHYKRRKKKKYKHPIIGPIAQILKDKLENKEVQNSFSNLDKSLGAIGNTCGKILKTAVTIRGLVILAGIALLGVTKYLDAKSKSFNEQYAPEGSLGFSGMSTGHISEKGKNQIKNDEGGFKEFAYWDKNGYSIGYGHHGLIDGKPIYKGQRITKEKADQLFDQDIKKFEKVVNDQLKANKITTPISQNMFDAMVNYAYNAGSLGDKFLAKLKAGDYKGACAELEVGKENLDRMAGIRKTFSSDITEDNKLKSEAPVVRGGGIIPNSSGKIHRYQNNTMIGNYRMNNTVAHGGQYYIDLSQRAEAYLRDVGGSGLVTSGAEGDTHVLGSGMTHEAGNKVDVVSSTKTNEGWANTAIPFLKNKNTAFVVFEGFTKQAFLEIRSIIYSKIDSDLKKQCESKARQAGWGSLGGKYLDYADDAKSMKNGRHLDIGILTNAYTENYYKQEEAENAKKIKKQKKELEEQKRKKKEQEELERKRKEQEEKNKKKQSPILTTIPNNGKNKTDKLKDMGTVDDLALENKKTLTAKKKGK